MQLSRVRYFNSVVLVTVFAAIICVAAACGEKKTPGGRITIRNDVLDKEYNSFVVDRVVTKGGTVPFRKTLNPGDEQEIPFSHVRTFYVTRRYADHTKLYQVKCPSNFANVATFKLIDIHTNRLSGGCKTIRRGTRDRGGFIHWEE